MLPRVLIDEPIEVLGEFTGHFRWSTRPGAVDQAGRALGGKAIDPLAQRGIGKLQRVGNGLEALPLDNGAHGLSTAEDTCFFGLFHEGVEGGQSIRGKVQFEGAHARGLQHKVLQQYTNPTARTCLPSYRHKAFPTQIFQKPLVAGLLSHGEPLRA